MLSASSANLHGNLQIIIFKLMLNGRYITLARKPITSISLTKSPMDTGNRLVFFSNLYVMDGTLYEC